MAGPWPLSDEMAAAGQDLLDLGCAAVLVKGGHLSGDRLADVLVTGSGVEIFQHDRIESRNLHGTGCTLASAIASGLAQGLDLRDAVLRGRAYVLEAIRRAPGLGQGSRPARPRSYGQAVFRRVVATEQDLSRTVVRIRQL